MDTLLFTLIRPVADSRRRAASVCVILREGIALRRFTLHARPRPDVGCRQRIAAEREIMRTAAAPARPSESVPPAQQLRRAGAVPPAPSSFGAVANRLVPASSVRPVPPARAGPSCTLSLQGVLTMNLADKYRPARPRRNRRAARRRCGFCDGSRPNRRSAAALLLESPMGGTGKTAQRQAFAAELGCLDEFTGLWRIGLREFGVDAARELFGRTLRLRWGSTTALPCW